MMIQANDALLFFQRWMIMIMIMIMIMMMQANDALLFFQRWSNVSALLFFQL